MQCCSLPSGSVGRGCLLRRAAYGSTNAVLKPAAASHSKCQRFVEQFFSHKIQLLKLGPRQASGRESSTVHDLLEGPPAACVGHNLQSHPQSLSQRTASCPCCPCPCSNISCEYFGKEMPHKTMRQASRHVACCKVSECLKWQDGRSLVGKASQIETILRLLKS